MEHRVQDIYIIFSSTNEKGKSIGQSLVIDWKLEFILSIGNNTKQKTKTKTNKKQKKPQPNKPESITSLIICYGEMGKLPTCKWN